MSEVGEASAGSRGSRPVAWAVFEADGHCVGTYATQEHARIVLEELARDGMVYEPLYRQPGPTLADAEREAIKSLRRALFDLFEHVRKRHPLTMAGYEYSPAVADKMQRASQVLEATEDYEWQG